MPNRLCGGGFSLSTENERVKIEKLTLRRAIQLETGCKTAGIHTVSRLKNYSLASDVDRPKRGLAARTDV